MRFKDLQAKISIHALRVEGDLTAVHVEDRAGYFYPRPPGGGRLLSIIERIGPLEFLSTPSGWRATLDLLLVYQQALRFLSTPSGWRATLGATTRKYVQIYFYPRPPGGGRHNEFNTWKTAFEFLSTPSGWRATLDGVERHTCPRGFLSTPSGWRATAKTDKVFICFCAKGRRICLFKTRKEKNLPVAF